MKANFQLWGIHDPQVVVIKGHAQYFDRAEEIIDNGLKKTVKTAALF
ncbi:hypothetical protein ACFVQB_07180 [Paenibacillus sp. NPDC057886]